MEQSAEFLETARELYAVPPGEFVAARDDLVRRARADHRLDLARALAGLRRPTQSAWVVNLLVRERGELVAELLELAEEFRPAYEAGAGDQLRELSTRRQRLVSQLITAARRLAGEAGVRVSPELGRDVEGTLGAALVDPDVAEQVRGATLAAAVEYAGFGPVWAAPGPAVVRDRGANRSGAEKKTPRGRNAGVERLSDPGRRTDERSGGRRRTDDGGRAGTDRRTEAERRVAEARAAVAEAERDLADRDNAVDEAVGQANAARDEVDRLRTQLRDAEERAKALERGVRAATKRQQRSADHLATARGRLADATRRAQRAH
ncbi:hypothetical protein [Actinopolymorpha sp. B9G3]|uniref:hypothetical protein n=1 Tax=Actinopolymorpha sp. B9G3 TaxID=3158970 RepID=UPI0032D92535